MSDTQTMVMDRRRPSLVERRNNAKKSRLEARERSRQLLSDSNAARHRTDTLIEDAKRLVAASRRRRD